MEYAILDIEFKTPLKMLGHEINSKKHLLIRQNSSYVEVPSFPGIVEWDFEKSGVLSTEDKRRIDCFHLPFLEFISDKTLKSIDSIEINELFIMGVDSIEERDFSKINCLKIKCGRLELEKEISLTTEILHMNSNLKLRVDSNEKWSIDQCLRFNRAFSDNIQYFEEPFPELSSYADAQRLCFASDFLTSKNAYSNLKDLFDFFIIKPNTYPSFKELLKFISQLQSDGKGIVLSSLFESKYGLDSLAKFANKLSLTEPHGLGTDRYITYDYKQLDWQPWT